MADAVQTLELLTDFRDTMHEHIGQLDRVRVKLVEFALLGTSVDRVVSMLRPLTELTALRRLNPDELRQAARVILEGRSTRISSRPGIVPLKDHLRPAEPSTDETGADASTELVPLPIEDDADLE